MADNQLRGAEVQDCPAIRVTQNAGCPSIRVRLAGGGCDGSIAVLNEHTTTVKTGPETTADYISNDAIGIYGDDGNEYTLAEWNALFEAAGFDKDAMTVEPLGIYFNAFDIREAFLFDRFLGRTYNAAGTSQGNAGELQVGMYSVNPISAVASGTDYTTGKGWAVTDDGDGFLLTEANTGQSWKIAKGCSTAFAHQVFNIKERTEQYWAMTEWLRHRMAIDSGVATTAADGTLGYIEIFNASGAQAAVGEDMYFWVKELPGDAWTNTNILAKYNNNNLPGAGSSHLTQAIADAIYNSQKAQGINMNDTGVNSGTKPILAPGSKGAELIAVSGKWYIITPYITNANATVSSALYNLPDSPHHYFAKSKEAALPSDSLLFGLYLNAALFSSLFSYLNTVEGRGLIVPLGNTVTCARFSSATTWCVHIENGAIVQNSASSRPVNAIAISL